MDAIDLRSLAGCKYSNLGINGFRTSGHPLAGLANDLDLSEQHTSGRPPTSLTPTNPTNALLAALLLRESAT